MHAIGGRVLIVLLAGTITCSVGVSLAAQDEAMSGYGTATIDGTKASGEWDGAAMYEFDAVLPAASGGGTVPASLYVMNDAVNLYIGLEVFLDAVDEGLVDFYFDNNDDGLRESGDLNVTLYASGGLTSYNWVEETMAWNYDADTERSSAVGNTDTFTFYEFSLALEDPTRGQGFSLVAGDRVGLRLVLLVKPAGSDGEWSFVPEVAFFHVLIVPGAEDQAEESG